MVTDTVDDALAETVEDAVSVVPDDAGVGASSGTVSLDTARLELEGMAEPGRLFEVEALFVFDPATQLWKTYIVGAPAFAQTLASLNISDSVSIRRR